MIDETHPCGDPTCHRGSMGRWNYHWVDGPCGAADCKWPKDLPRRPHFTDTPTEPIVDAGAVALAEKNKKKD
jgi:hypothetical protein